jgi:FtsP/CotA-like multicopper oxidase with cupredoxin domain
MQWHEPVTEKPVLNTTEIWEFVNTTDDAHLIHLHLVRFQVLDRKPFDVNHFLLTQQLRGQWFNYRIFIFEDVSRIICGAQDPLFLP